MMKRHFYLLGYLIYWPRMIIPIFKKPVSQQKYLLATRFKMLQSLLRFLQTWPSALNSMHVGEPLINIYTIYAPLAHKFRRKIND